MTLWDAPIDAGRCYNFIPRVLRFDGLMLAVPFSVSECLEVTGR